MSLYQPTPERRELKLITLNTQLLPISNELPGDPSRFLPTALLEQADKIGRLFLPSTTSQERRADAMADMLIKEKPDIVCLQEVFDRPARRRLIARLSPFLPFIAEPNSQNLVPGNSGLMTLSRFPFMAIPKCHMWSARAGTDMLAAKGLMVTALDLTDIAGGLCAVIVNVHMQAGKHPSIRSGQLVELRRAIAATLHDDVVKPHYRPPRKPEPGETLQDYELREKEPFDHQRTGRWVRSYFTLVGGDFNIVGDSKEYETFDELRFDAPKEAFHPARDAAKARGVTKITPGCTTHQPFCDLAKHVTNPDEQPPDTNDEGRLDYWFLLGGIVSNGVSIDVKSVEHLDTRSHLFSDHDGVVANLVLLKTALQEQLDRFLADERARTLLPIEVKFLESEYDPLTGEKAAGNKTLKGRRVAAAAEDLISVDGSVERKGRRFLLEVLQATGDGSEFVNAAVVGYVDRAVQYFDATEIVLPETGRPRSRREANDEMEHTADTCKPGHIPKRKAVGRRHAMSDVVDAESTIGKRYDMRWCRRVTYFDNRSAKLRFESGATFDVLNRALGADNGIKPGFGLKSQPGYEGLTYGGVLSVGGHGSSVQTGPLCSQVRWIKLAGIRDGWCYRTIEWPGEDDDRVQRSHMKAALVGLGLVGVITELEIDVERVQRIAEVRTRAKWRSLSRELDDLMWWAGWDVPQNQKKEVAKEKIGESRLMGTPHGLEIWINPYDLENVVVGKRWRTDAPLGRARELTLRNSVSTFAAQRVLERQKRTGRIRHRDVEEIHRFSLDSVVSPEPVVMSHADGISFGAPNVVDTLAIAVAIPYEKLPDAIRAISQVAIEMAREDEPMLHGRLLGSPIGVRFVGPCEPGRRPYLAPQFPEGVTAMIELPTLRDFRGAEEALTRLCRALVNMGARPHWGQYLPITREDVANLYKNDVCRFVAARRDLDPQDVFGNALSERLGLTLDSCAHVTRKLDGECRICKHLKRQALSPCPPPPPPAR